MKMITDIAEILIMNIGLIIYMISPVEDAEKENSIPKKK